MVRSRESQEKAAALLGRVCKVSSNTMLVYEGAQTKLESVDWEVLSCQQSTAVIDPSSRGVLPDSA